MALVKYNNRSILNVTALGSIASGGLNLITTNTISSGVSSSSFTSNIDSTYDTYVFKYINIHLSNDSAFLQVNFRDGGSNFDATKQTTYFRAYHGEDGSGATLESNSTNDKAQSTADQPLIVGLSNDNDIAGSGTMFLFSPSSTTHITHFISHASASASAYARQDFVAGYLDVTAAIDGVTFKPSAGTIDSGIIKMYGLSKS